MTTVPLYTYKLLLLFLATPYYYYYYFTNPVLKILGVKSKVKNRSVEWLQRQLKSSITIGPSADCRLEC